MSRREPFTHPPLHESAKPIWRSVEEKSESANVRQKRAEAEFDTPVHRLVPSLRRRQTGNSEPPAAGAVHPQPENVEREGALGRRGFLSLSGAAASAVGMGACIRRPEKKILPFVRGPEYVIPGIPLHFASTLELGGEAFGVVVESHEGRPTKIEGNPLHPASLGATNLAAQAAVMDLYDPDRAQSPSRAPTGESDFGSAPGRWRRKKQSLAAVDAALLPLLEEAEKADGSGWAFVLPQSSSPTQDRLARKLKARFPSSMVVSMPSPRRNAVRGAGKALTGGAQGVRVVPRLDEASVVFAADSDFLGSEWGAVAATKAFSKTRKPSGKDKAMSRLYVAESLLSVTGMNADHRLRVASQDVATLLLELAQVLDRKHRLQIPTADLAGQLKPSLPERRRWVEALADDLVRAKSRALVLAGSRQDEHVHALAHAINHALGSLDRCCEAYPASEAEQADYAPWAQLADALRQSKVRRLVVLGANPAYELPADLKFVEALRSASPEVFVASRLFDETAALATWHIPLSHDLESWGDAIAFDGSWSLRQPMIAPLWQSRSLIEMLALLAGEKRAKGYDLVRATLRQRLQAERGASPAAVEAAADGLVANTLASSPADNKSGATKDEDGAKRDEGRPPRNPAIDMAFDRMWSKGLQAGVLQGLRATKPLSPRVDWQAVVASWQRFREVPSVGPDRFEAVFTADYKLGRGESGNNPWLLELPDPVTKLSWGNAALFSPKSAKHLGLQSGQVVRLSSEGGAQLEAPVYVVPGQADWSVTLPLGWGRAAIGEYGKGVGFAASALQNHNTPDRLLGVRITPLPRSVDLAQTQTHHSMEGRPLAIDATLDQYREEPDFASWRSVEMSVPPLWKEVDYTGVHRWGLSIDLSSCTGCNACVVACQAENNLPNVGKREMRRGRDMYWIRIDRYFVGEDENNPQVALQPVACQQCEEAPCENVCPVNATVHTPEGLNAMAYNRCIGTRYCMNNCPYKVRRFNYLAWHDRDPHGYLPETKKMQFNPNVTVRMRGVMEKCTYCVHRINAASAERKRSNERYRDGDIVTACQQACPANAIAFGDLNDPRSELSQRLQEGRRYRLLAEVGAQPRTTFLAKIRNPNPALSSSSVHRVEPHQAKGAEA